MSNKARCNRGGGGIENRIPRSCACSSLIRGARFSVYTLNVICEIFVYDMGVFFFFFFFKLIFIASGKGLLLFYV